MNRLAAGVLGLVLVGFAGAAPAPADDTAAKLVGTWVVTKAGGDAPEGTQVAFTKDGKMTVVVKADTEAVTIAGTYKADKNKLKVELKVGDKDTTEELTIKKLTDDELELEDKDKKVDVLKKKK